MTIKFSSKEIHFLKSDSDQIDVKPPDFFFSDLLLDKPQPVQKFENRLCETQIPGDRFLCAAIQVDQANADAVIKKAQDTFEATFNQVLSNDRGIWEMLDDTSFAMAFWDYDEEAKALALFESLKKKVSDSFKADILAGFCFFPFHDFSTADTFASAIKAIDHAAFFGKDTLQQFDAISLNISADRLYQLGRFEDAIKEYQQGLRLEPRNTNLMNSLGVCFGVLDKRDRAKKLFKEALAVAPNEVMLIYNLGLLHHINGTTDKAIAYLRKAHAENRELFEVELLLGQMLLKQDHSDQAMPHLKQAAELNPGSGLACRLMGEIFLAAEKFEKAGQQFNTAIKRNPADAVSLSGYARCLELQDKNLPIALSLAENSVTLDPMNDLFRKRLAIIREKIDAALPENSNMKTA